jgi:hypothetical protein
MVFDELHYDIEDYGYFVDPEISSTMHSPHNLERSSHKVTLDYQYNYKINKALIILTTACIHATCAYGVCIILYELWQ